LRVTGELLEILRHARRSLVPGFRVARIDQNQGAHLEADERRDRLAGRRGQTHRRDGPGRDLSIDRDEIADRVEAQVPHHGQYHDDEQRDDEGLGRQPRAGQLDYFEQGSSRCAGSGAGK
jgi:hypothetical protein